MEKYNIPNVKTFDYPQMIEKQIFPRRYFYPSLDTLS